MSDELTLEIYEAKVRDLTEKLTRLKEKCDNLTKENDALGKAQAKFSSDKQDIVEFLNIKVREHEEQITLLEEKVRSQEDEIRERDLKARAELDHVISESKRELEQAQSQGLRYKSELDQLFEFKGRKDELEFQLKRTSMLLETKEKEYKDIIHSMERKVLQDKNQMKKEMLQKVNEAVANFRRVADQQMAETTKRAIRENMAITSQLKKMSAKTIDLLSENQALSNKLAKLKTSNSLLTESEGELAKKNQANQRVIKMLVDRLKESDEMLEIAYDSAKKNEPTDFGSLEDTRTTEYQNLVTHLEQSKEELEVLTDKVKTFEDFIESLHSSLVEMKVFENPMWDFNLDQLRSEILNSFGSLSKKMEDLEQKTIGTEEASPIHSRKLKPKTKIDISP
ncbi:hypothetical protein HDU97_007985, partial [Phlyctochytrium planicorne]